MSDLVEVKVPDIGDFKNIPVIEALVQPGDTVGYGSSFRAEQAMRKIYEHKCAPLAHRGEFREWLRLRWVPWERCVSD